MKEVVCFIIILLNIAVSIGLKINQTNCINNAVLYDEDSFDVDIRPNIAGVLNCTLKLPPNKRNIYLIVSTANITKQKDNSCPLLEIKFYANGKPKPLSSNCGGIFDKRNTTIENLTHVDFTYDPKGLGLDTDTVVAIVWTAIYKCDATDTFRCENGICINSSKKCDKERNCVNGEDEKCDITGVISKSALIIIILVSTIVAIGFFILIVVLIKKRRSYSPIPFKEERKEGKAESNPEAPHGILAKPGDGESEIPAQRYAEIKTPEC